MCTQHMVCLVQLSIAAGSSLLLSAPGVACSPEQLLPEPASLTGLGPLVSAAGQEVSFLLHSNSTGATLGAAMRCVLGVAFCLAGALLTGQQYIIWQSSSPAA